MVLVKRSLQNVQLAMAKVVNEEMRHWKFQSPQELKMVCSCQCEEKETQGCNGGPSGDLLINIEEKKHEFLQREGMNVIYDLYLNFADAALGTSVEVPVIGGKVKVKVPAGTQSGKIFPPERQRTSCNSKLWPRRSVDSCQYLDTEKIERQRTKNVGRIAKYAKFQTTTRQDRQRLF